MAYSIILVDDEDEVRGRIASKIEDRTDFEIIGSAANGYDALDLLDESIPDVVITDIKMPFVDGIELTRQIRDRYPTVIVAIISGYDDYTYLKEAINLDVAAYLSKPISVDNIKVFLDKIKERLVEEDEHVRLIENYEFNQIKNRVFRKYLNGTSIDYSDTELLDELHVDLSASFIVVGIELVNCYRPIMEVEKKKNQCLLIIDELISEVFSSYHLINGDHIVSIITTSGNDVNKKLDILLNKIVLYTRKYLSVELAVGVSLIDGFSRISDLYRQCCIVLAEYEIVEHNSINYYNEEQTSNCQRTLTMEELNTFRKNMRSMSDEDFYQYTMGLGNEIIEKKDYDYFNVIISISGLIFEYANSIETDMDVTLDMGTVNDYVESKDIIGFFKLISGSLVELKSNVVKRKTKKSMKIMTDIMNFIEQNFSDQNMSMDMVCDAFHISVSYLSALFKKETETTFNRYLVSKRIDHAKFLLKNTEDKMVYIAEKCGYKDVYYFSHSFKKVTGITPRKYRKDENI